MEILDLNLNNFRNFTSKKIIFDNKLTGIIGPNGSGKSNILEAISLLCGIRPARVNTDLDLVKFGKSEAKIEADIIVEETKKLTVNIVVLDELTIRKSYLVDSIRKRFADLALYLSIVVFHPADLDLVSGSPSLRRKFIDILLSSVSREYYRNLSSYNKVLVRRNRLLNRIIEGKAKVAELDFWDDRLIEHSKIISKYRVDFFQYLNFMEKSMAIANFGKLSWELKQSVLTLEKLNKNRERDIAAGMTLSGPQRDDFRFLFGGKDLAFFGSRGEQRMAVLALKLAEVEYYQVKKLSRPILALDDIFSELDWEHREAVLSVVSKQQTIFTAAENESIPKILLKKAKIIEL